MSRYQIVGVDPKTEEYLGNTVEVHETFVVIYYPKGSLPFSRREIDNIQKATQKDVVFLPEGTELKVLKVIDKEKRDEEHSSPKNKRQRPRRG